MQSSKFQVRTYNLEVVFSLFFCIHSSIVLILTVIMYVYVSSVVVFSRFSLRCVFRAVAVAVAVVVVVEWTKTDTDRHRHDYYYAFYFEKFVILRFSSSYSFLDHLFLDSIFLDFLKDAFFECCIFPFVI